CNYTSYSSRLSVFIPRLDSYLIALTYPGDLLLASHAGLQAYLVLPATLAAYHNRVYLQPGRFRLLLYHPYSTTTTARWFFRLHRFLDAASGVRSGGITAY